MSGYLAGVVRQAGLPARWAAAAAGPAADAGAPPLPAPLEQVETVDAGPAPATRFPVAPVSPPAEAAARGEPRDPAFTPPPDPQPRHVSAHGPPPIEVVTSTPPAFQAADAHGAAGRREDASPAPVERAAAESASPEVRRGPSTENTETGVVREMAVAREAMAAGAAGQSAADPSAAHASAGDGSTTAVPVARRVVRPFAEVLAEARRWVAATPAPGEPVDPWSEAREPAESTAQEDGDRTDAPRAPPAAPRPAGRPYAREVETRDEQVQLSIGTITVTIEDPAAARPAAAPARPAPAGPAPDPRARLRRAYLRTD